MRPSPPALCTLAAGLLVGCGRTRPDEVKRIVVDDTGPPAMLGHAPELVGLQLSFEEVNGDLILQARARLGDIDDDLVPGGTVTGWLRDADGAERTSLDAIPLGSPPTDLPEPTLLVVPFSIARDPGDAWEVQLTLTDRAGNSSEPGKAAWMPPEDTGSFE